MICIVLNGETQAEFEARYLEGFPRVVFGETVVAMPCTCEDGGGPTHWAGVNNTPGAVADHLEHESLLASNRGENR